MDKKKLLEFFFIAKYSEPDRAIVTHSWPSDLSEKDEKYLNSAARFAVPFYGYTCEAVEKYCFIMTSGDYVKTYGFCRFSPSLDSCLCILSLNPWHEFFYTVLDNLSRQCIESNKDPKPYLDGLANYNMSYPKSEMLLTFDSIQMDPWRMPAMPPELGLPKLIESKNLLEYYNAISPDTIISIFTMMLLENRMVFYSSKLGRLTSCIHAACSLLYPLTWQHVLIPILTPDIVEFVGCPTPIIIGVHKGLQSRVENKIRTDPSAHGIIEVNLDENVIQRDASQEYTTLPYAVHYFLYDRLKGMTPDRNKRLKTYPLDDNFARAFLDALVALIGDYRVGLVANGSCVLDPYEKEENFNKEKFYGSRPDSYRTFLEQLTGTQQFQMFCRNRVDRMNDGAMSLCDEFEKAKTIYKPIGPGPPQVRRMVTNIKTRIAHEGKEKFKYVRDGMDAIKRNLQARKGNQSQTTTSYNESRLTGSVPDLSQTSHISSPTTFSTHKHEIRKNSKSSNEISKHYDIIPESELQFTSLMDDPDIQAYIQRSKSDPDLLDQSSDDSENESAIVERVKPPRPRAPSWRLPMIPPPPRPSNPPPPRPPQPTVALKRSQPPPKPPKPSRIQVGGEDSVLSRTSDPLPRAKPRRSIRNSIMATYEDTSLISMSPEKTCEDAVDPILRDFDPITAGDVKLQCDDDVVRPRTAELPADGIDKDDVDLMLPMNSIVSSMLSSRQSLDSYHTARSSILDEELEESRDTTVFNTWLQTQVSQSNDRSGTDGMSSNWMTFDD